VRRLHSFASQGGSHSSLRSTVTVRAFSAEKRLLDDLHTKIDVTTKVSHCVRLHIRLLTSWPDVVHFLDDKPLASPQFRRARCRSCLCDHAVGFIWTRKRGLGGLLCAFFYAPFLYFGILTSHVTQITSAMAFTTSVYWACRHWTVLELDLKYVILDDQPICFTHSRQKFRGACRGVSEVTTGATGDYRVEPSSGVLAFELQQGCSHRSRGSCN
jgi:hypothetical protein